MNRLFSLLLLFPITLAFAQETRPRLRPGAQIAFVYSGNYSNGIAPMLSLDYGKHQLVAGPRWLYDYLRKYKASAGYQNDQLVLDASYRYFPIEPWHKLRPFASLSVEYAISYGAMNRNYGPDVQSPHGPVFDHSFEGRIATRDRNLNLYGGLGLEVAPWKHVYFTASGGFGPYFNRRHQTIENLDNGTMEYDDQHGWSFYRWGWMAAVSGGVRF